MQKTSVTIALAAVLVVAAFAGAHEGHAHKALGTITAVQGDNVEIKTTAGKALTLILDNKTTVTRGKDKLDPTALKAGERVSVEYIEVKKVMTARSFKLGTTQTVKK
jgi:hypothetical protein